MSKKTSVEAVEGAVEPSADSQDGDGSQRKTLGVKRDEGADGALADGSARGGPDSRRPGLRSRFRPGGLKPTTKPAARERAPKESRQAAPRQAAPGRADANRAMRGQPVARQARDGERTQRAGRPAPASSDDRRAVADRAPAPDVVAVTAAEDVPTGVRLSKVMAERGLCSRREADAIIERGWVSVDGRRVSELGTRIDPDADIELAPQAKKRQAEQATLLLHKPVGYVSGQPEPGYEPAVTLIGPHNQFDKEVAQRFHASHLRGLAPAGRLDIDSTGLLVLTQNGRIARQLIGEDSKIEKEYIVRVQGHLDAEGLALLNHGLELDGRKLRPAKVEWINDDQLRFILREGRKRQIRRMCELVGLMVTGLKRTRIGHVKLGDLPLGEWRFLAPDEHF